MRLRAGQATDVGRVRSTNQDRALVRDGLYVVADGMGGHRAGEVAAQLTVDTLDTAFTAPSSDALVEVVRVANREVWQHAATSGELQGMGTTVVALASVPDGDAELVAVAHVGDSRVYYLRNDELLRITDDHSVVEELVRAGRLTPEQAKVHHQRSILTRAIGVDDDVEVDLVEVAPAAGDRFVLCSDGLTGEVADHVIAAVLRRLADPTDAARELVRLALEHGGHDNVTVVVVDVVDDDGSALDASASTAGSARLQGRATEPRDHSSAAAAPAHVPRARTRAGAPRSPGVVTPRSALFAVVLAAIVGVGIWAIRNDPGTTTQPSTTPVTTTTTPVTTTTTPVTTTTTPVTTTTTPVTSTTLPPTTAATAAPAPPTTPAP